jgi:hypothetical protein
MQVGRTDHDKQLIPSEWVRRSMREWKADGNKGVPLSAAAVDCARGGEDRMCLAKRYGDWVGELATWPGRQVPDGPSAVILFLPLLETTRHLPILVDIGASAGGGVVDSLKLSGLRLNVRPVPFGGGSNYRDRTGLLRMTNLRAEMYWRLKEALDPAGGAPLKLPNDSDLLAELCSVRWESDNFKVKVEDKDDIKKRLQRSPDKADAVAMLMLADQGVAGGWVAPDRSPPPERQWFAGAFLGSSGGFMGVPDRSNY